MVLFSIPLLPGLTREVCGQPLLRLAVSLCLLVALALGLVSGALATVPPDEKIRDLTTRVLEQIRNDQDLRAGDIERISRFVDQTVMPHIDFERMTALAVGRGWRQANPQQRQALMAEFRLLLIRTYSGALSAVGDQTVRMRPLRADPGAAEVVVRTEIVPRRGDPVQVDYRLERVGDDWRIYDVNVMGIWLVETYRSQFAQEISQRGVDGLIRTLGERNRQARLPNRG